MDMQGATRPSIMHESTSSNVMGNKFSVLSQEAEEVVHRSEKNEILNSTRIACSEASSSRLNSVVHEPIKEVTNNFYEVKEEESEEEFDTNYEDVSFIPESSMSSKQKKKGSKKNFRGSHHKGRPRH